MRQITAVTVLILADAKLDCVINISCAVKAHDLQQVIQCLRAGFRHAGGAVKALFVTVFIEIILALLCCEHDGNRFARRKNCKNGQFQLDFQSIKKPAVKQAFIHLHLS